MFFNRNLPAYTEGENENRIITFIKKYKYPLIIFGSIILIIFVILIFSGKEDNEDKNEDKKDNVDNVTYYIELEGENEITIYEKDEYMEPGYYGYDSNKNDLTDKVVVNNKVNVSKVGKYKIIYSLYDVSETRIIHVIEKPKYLPSIELKGESTIYLSVGENYIEPGYSASDEKDGDITDKVTVTSNLDTSRKGNYTIAYSVTNSSEETIEITRKIIVTDSEIKLSVSNRELTNGNININVTISDDYFDYLVLPNGNRVTTKNHTYVVSDNGTYKFKSYNKFGKTKEDSVKIDNIDKEKPTGSCSGTYGNGTSKIIVNANDNYGISKYVINGKTFHSDVINLNSEVKNPSITIYDNAGNTQTISCNLKLNKSDLEIHFIAVGTYDDAILIRTANKTILIDGGRYDCKEYVTPYLKTLGVKKIDVMIGSHLHYDHIQAQKDILENFSVGDIYYPDDIFNCKSKSTCDSNDQKYIVNALKNHNKTPIIVKPATKKVIGEMELYFLSPDKIRTGNGAQNYNSFIFILKFYNNTFMFTGDAMIEINVEEMKKNAKALGISLDIDLLKYPHHGNADLGEPLMKEIKPQYVIVPNYGAAKYPYSSNRNLISKYNAKMYKQSDSKTGNILVTSDGNNIKIITDVKADNYKR